MTTLAKRITKTGYNTLISLVVVTVLWVVALWALDVTPYIGKNPVDVFNFMFTVEKAAENQALVFSALGQTMLDASIGFAFGIFFATLIAVLFTLSKGIEQALMPIAMLLRSVPLIAMTPIIILIFGREQLTVAVEMDDTFKFALDTAREPLEFWDTFHQAPWLLAKYETPDDSISFIEFSTISKDLLDRLTSFVLSEQQVEILKMRNGFASSEPMTLDDIGKVYGVTRERIRQIESKAHKRVYAFLDGVDLKNYWEVIESVSLEFQEREANTPLALAA